MKKLVLSAILLASAMPAHAVDDAKARQCLIELCGSEQSLANLHVKGPFGEIVPVNVKQYIKDDVNPMIESIRDLAIETLESRINQLQRVDVEQLTFTPSQNNYFLALSTIVRITPLMQAMAEIDLGTSSIKLNFEKVRAQIPANEVADLEKRVKFLNVILSTDAMRSSSQFSNSSVTYDLLKMYATLSAKDDGERNKIWSTFMSQFGMMTTVVEMQFGTYAFDGFDTGLMSRAAADDSKLTDGDKRDVMRIIAQTYTYSAFADAKVTQAAVDAGFDGKKILEMTDWKNRLAQTRAALAGFKANPDQTFAQLNGTCTTDIANAMAASPSPFARRKTLELMQEVKRAAKVAAAKYATGDALKRAEAAIDGSTFSTPPTIDQFRDKLESTLKSTTEAQRKRNLKSKVAQSPSNMASLAFAVIGQATMTGAADAASILGDDVKKFCESIVPPIFEDHAIPMTGAVHIGWQTVIFPEIGSGVIAHEIGHVVSYAIGRNANEPQAPGYAEVRTCSADQHKLLVGAASFAGNFQQYAEEDWADAFAATTMKELQKNWPFVKNFGCALALNMKEQFTGQKIVDLSGGDVHSTGYFRALQFQVNMGQKLPASCQQSISADELSAASRSCAK